ncbi:MAG: hypothetical protein PHU66_09100 [Bacteroidaceae bacterium]|nr:hypothetical protein [Bacteroidaceae bacterium]
MKKILTSLIFIVLFTSCTDKWEYKTITINGEEKENSSDFRAIDFEIPDSTLNVYGNQGWELAGIYTNIETVHPNFGDSRYVTGIQPNTRTLSVNYVLKRKK